MTREEAIRFIEQSDLFWNMATEKEREALDIAIESLSVDSNHDGCDGCRYEQNTEYEYPCNECKQTYKDMWMQKPNDFVEVVRCKDCIHWQKTNIETIDGEPIYDCPFCGEWADANGFCSFGERREP